MLPCPQPSRPHLSRRATGPGKGARRAVWAAVAALCVAGGAIASVLGAHAVARNDATSARQASQQTSAATRRGQSSSRSSARKTCASAPAPTSPATRTRRPRNSTAWAQWARTLRHYPELEQLGLVTLVHGSELTSFAAARRPARPSAAASAKPAVRRCERRGRDHARGAARQGHARGHAPLLLPRARRARRATAPKPAGWRGLLREGNRRCCSRATLGSRAQRWSPSAAPRRWK